MEYDTVEDITIYPSSWSPWSPTISVVSDGVRYRERRHQLSLVFVPVIPHGFRGLSRFLCSLSE